MSITTLLILIMIGVIAGMLAGVLGIGGAIIMIPAMVFMLGINQHTAQGTSLWVMLPPISIFAALNYMKEGQVNLKFALVLIVAFVIGSYFGSKIALNIPETALKRVFAILLIAVAAKMLFTK